MITPAGDPVAFATVVSSTTVSAGITVVPSTDAPGKSVRVVAVGAVIAAGKKSPYAVNVPDNPILSSVGVLPRTWVVVHRAITSRRRPCLPFGPRIGSVAAPAVVVIAPVV